MVLVPCLLSLLSSGLPQHLEPNPLPGVVGQPVTVRATVRGAPVADLEVHVRDAAGARTPAGRTDAAGYLRFVPSAVGSHVFEATIDGVAVLAPLPVITAHRTWIAAFGLVPLGLALFWANWRSLRRRSGGGAAEGDATGTASRQPPA